MMIIALSAAAPHIQSLVLNRIKLKNTIILIISTLVFSSCKTQNAIQFFEQAIQFEEKNNYREAIKMLNKAIELDPYFEKAYLNRAIDKSIIGEYKSAIEDLSKMISLNDTAIEPYVWRAEYKRMIDLYDEAMLDVEKALELKNAIYDGSEIKSPKEFRYGEIFPEGSNYNIEIEFIAYERGAINYHLGNYEQALKDIEYSEQPETEPINTHFYKGLILIEFDRFDEACSELKKALNSGENVPKELLNEFCNKVKTTDN